MARVQVLTDDEKKQIKSKLAQFRDLGHQENLIKFLFEKHMSEGEVEIRFFPTPEEGKPESIYFEVKVEQSSDWYTQFSGISNENLRNGNPHYKALAEELEDLVASELGQRTDFVKVSPVSDTFQAEVQL
jgi:hypothetical protein